MADFRHRLKDIGSGISTAAYLIALPVAVSALWSRPTISSRATFHGGLIVLMLLWSYVAIRLGIAVVGEIRGRVQTGGIAWLAGAIISLASFLVPAWAGAATPPLERANHSLVALTPLSIPVALVAKRRRDELVQLGTMLDDEAVDREIDVLRQRNDGFLFELIRLIGASPSGRVAIRHDATASAMKTPHPIVVVPVSFHGDTWTIAHAQIGTRLDIPSTMTSDDIQRTAVALHPRGRVVVTATLVETLRELVLRDDGGTVVIHTGPEELDPAIAAKCVVATTANTTPSVVISLLGPTAEIYGLSAPLDSDVRRKCTEMLAYLASHPSSPVSGDRLRTRVLGSRRGDASVRTLNNVASALRRSLGHTHGSPRLAPVGPQGMYHTIDVVSDIETLIEGIESTRGANPAVRRDALVNALTLIRGEPLVGEPRGYEWFIAEGHHQRAQRHIESAVVELLEIAETSGDPHLEWFARDAIGRFDALHPLAGSVENSDPELLGQLRGDGLR